VFDSTKTTSKEIAKKIWKKREGEIALGLFKVGWPGERMVFAQLCDEFLLSHTSTLSVSTQRNHQTFSKTLKAFFKDWRRSASRRSRNIAITDATNRQNGIQKKR